MALRRQSWYSAKTKGDGAALELPKIPCNRAQEEIRPAIASRNKEVDMKSGPRCFNATPDRTLRTRRISGCELSLNKETVVGEEDTDAQQRQPSNPRWFQRFMSGRRGTSRDAGRNRVSGHVVDGIEAPQRSVCSKSPAPR